MRRMRSHTLAAVLAASAIALASAQTETLDYAMLGRIRDEGLSRSQVMDHISWLSDVYGPRLTGSPAIQQASEWAMKKFGEWGLANVHQERWKLGKGWSLERFSAQLVEPQVQPLIGYPHEWSSGTKGPVTADVVRAQIATRGRLREVSRHARREDRPHAARARACACSKGPFILQHGSDRRWRRPRRRRFRRQPGRRTRRQRRRRSAQKLEKFYVDEGVVAIFDRGGDSDMASGGSDLSWQQQHPTAARSFPTAREPRDENAGKSVPAITLAVEHYNRMVRVLDKGVPVKVELNVETKFYDESAT